MLHGMLCLNSGYVLPIQFAEKTHLSISTWVKPISIVLASIGVLLRARLDCQLRGTPPDRK